MAVILLRYRLTRVHAKLLLPPSHGLGRKLLGLLIKKALMIANLSSYTLINRFLFLAHGGPFTLFTQASHSANILASIMHLMPTKMLTWHLIKEERED
jgi:hypothetical protein